MNLMKKVSASFKKQLLKKLTIRELDWGWKRRREKEKKMAERSNHFGVVLRLDVLNGTVYCK